MMSEDSQTINQYKQGFLDCVPTLVGYISVGLAAGVVGVASHVSVFEVFLLSTIVYAGSAQFMICALLLADSPLIVIVLTTFMVNVRHLLLSLTVAPYFAKENLWRRIFIGSLLTDESFGVAVYKAYQDKALNPQWMNSLNVTAYLCWIASCTIGAVLANWIPDPDKYGLDFALIAMFIALAVLTMMNFPKQLKRINYVLVLYVLIVTPILCLFMSASMAALVVTITGALLGGGLEHAKRAE